MSMLYEVFDKEIVVNSKVARPVAGRYKLNPVSTHEQQDKQVGVN
jgi:hypothetical protein